MIRDRMGRIVRPGRASPVSWLRAEASFRASYHVWSLRKGFPLSGNGWDGIPRDRAGFTGEDRAARVAMARYWLSVARGGGTR